MNQVSKEFEYDIFLSYSSVDKTEAENLFKQLSSSGLRVFWSDVSLKKKSQKLFLKK